MGSKSPKVCYVLCETCKTPMELYMAKSDVGEVIMTFECVECKQFTDVIAKVKAIQLPAMVN